MESYIFRTSAELDKLFAALAAAQAEIEGATKDKSNPYFRSKYADLASVWDAWQVVGPKNGLALIQAPLDADKVLDTGPVGTCTFMARQGILLGTLLGHKSGQYVNAITFFPAAKQDAQAYGSAITYARRYALAAMVGIAPEDDDGNAASGRAPATMRSATFQDNNGDLKKKLEEAFTKYRENKEKLILVGEQADKIGASELVYSVNQRLKELANGPGT